MMMKNRDQRESGLPPGKVKPLKPRPGGEGVETDESPVTSGEQTEEPEADRQVITPDGEPKPAEEPRPLW
jgi:hypothetical protein